MLSMVYGKKFAPAPIKFNQSRVTEGCFCWRNALMKMHKTPTKMHKTLTKIHKNGNDLKTNESLKSLVRRPVSEGPVSAAIKSLI